MGSTPILGTINLTFNQMKQKIKETITTANIQFHINILMKNYMQRRMYGLNLEINESIARGENPDELLAVQMNELHNLILKEKKENE